MTRMCAVGDNVIDWYPQEQLVFPGGSAANAAVFARRLGIEASYVGVLGSDEQAEFIASSLTAEGVDISHSQWRDEPSSRTDVLVDESGNRTFTGFLPPVSRIRLDAATRSHLQGAAWIHTGHSSFTESLLAELADIAPVSFDFSKNGLEYAEPLLPHIRYAAFSREEASVEDAVNLLRELIARGVKYAVVTRGGDGAIAVTPDGIFTQSATPAEVRDTIGAGDAFQTCFISNIVAGRTPTLALQAASRFAAEVCSYRGAFGHGQRTALTT